MNTLFLHIGLPKTGTTAIQHALKVSSDGSSWKFLPESTGLLRSPDLPSAWVNRVKRQLRSTDVVLSDENFVIGTRLLTEDPHAEAARAAQLVAAFDWPKTVLVVTVRPFHRWVESMCEDMQLHIDERSAAPEFFDGFLKNQAVDPLVPMLSRILDDVGQDGLRVIPHSAEGVVNRFFAAIGSPTGISGEAAYRRLNVTTPAPVAALAANLKSRNRRQQRWITKELKAHVSWPQEPVNFSPFTADQQRHLALISSETADSLQGLRNRFGLSFDNFDDWLEECRNISIRPGPESPEFEDYSKEAQRTLIQHLISRETGGLATLVRRNRTGFLPWAKVLLWWGPRAVLKRPLRVALRGARGF